MYGQVLYLTSVDVAGTNKDNNVPLPSKKNVHNDDLVHKRRKKTYTKRQQVSELAKRKYGENGQPFTNLDLQVIFRLTKAQAQRLIKHLHMKKFLFTADDLKKQGILFNGKRRERPQKYHLTEMKAKISEDNKNNAQIDTTEINPFEQYKIKTIRELLTQLASSACPYRYVHKIP